MQQLHSRRQSSTIIFKYVFILILLGSIYFISSIFYKPQKVGINEIANNSSRFKVVGNQILDSQNNPFVVRSVQYANFYNNIPGNPGWDQSLFYPLHFSATTVEQDFAKISSLGYNTVRLIFHNIIDAGYYNWLSPDPQLHKCKEGTNLPLSECINIQSVDNLVNTLNIAKKNNLSVILTFVRTTPNAYKTTHNYSFTNSMLYTSSVHDYGRFLTSFFTYLRDKNVLEAILAVQPDAEPFLYTNPVEFKVKIGDILDANHGYHTSLQHVVNSNFIMPDKNTWNKQSSPEIKALLNDAYINSFNYLYGAIKQVDPHLLMLYDQFAAFNTAAIPDWQVDDMTITNPKLRADITAMQIYPSNLNPDEKITTRMSFTPGFKESINQKPFLLMEYGIDKSFASPSNNIPFLLGWMRESCTYMNSGWNFFNYSGNNFGLKTMVQDNFQIARALSPNHLKNPCTDNLDNLILKGSSSAVFLVSNNVKYQFSDPDSILHYGFQLSDIITVTDDYLNRYTPGPLIKRAVKGSSPTIYYLENGQRRHIPDPDTLFSLGYTFDTISTLSDQAINNLPLGAALPSIHTSSTKPGDLNGDGLVNVFDFVKLLSGYGTIYTSADFAALLANYGK